MFEKNSKRASLEMQPYILFYYFAINNKLNLHHFHKLKFHKLHFLL